MKTNVKFSLSREELYNTEGKMKNSDRKLSAWIFIVFCSCDLLYTVLLGSCLRMNISLTNGRKLIPVINKVCTESISSLLEMKLRI
jgi:hypothetical protein